MTSAKAAAAALAVALFSQAVAAVPPAPDTTGTRLLAQPDISARHIVFAYDNDLWIVARTGGKARRLTEMEGAESTPRFSADGLMVAFTGSAGSDNQDAWMVPVAGGEPVRLTWHGGPDVVQDFLPDGRVMFASHRDLHTDRMRHFFAVAVDGGLPDRLPVPDGDDGVVAADGTRIAYSTMPPVFKTAVPQSKHYRGGDASRIEIMTLDEYGTQEIPQPSGRCNDLDPVWMDGRLYFSSDRSGEFNLFSFDPRTKRVEQLTHYREFPILNLEGGAGRLVYEQASWLHVYDPGAGSDTRVSVAVDAELRETRPRTVSGPGFLRAVAPSPRLDRVALEYRGEIVVVETDGGKARNLSASTGANDRSPAWSPDGRQVAWFSDLSGEYALMIRPADGNAQARGIRLHGAGFYEDLKWSPDGRHLSFRDNAMSLYVIDAETGRSVRVAQEQAYTPSVAMTHAWSPDSKWLAYTLKMHGMLQAVYLYSLAGERSYRMTDGMVDVGDPVFDPDGTMLYVSASIDAGPFRDWFSQWKYGGSTTRMLYAIALDPRMQGTGSASGGNAALATAPAATGVGPDAAFRHAVALPGSRGGIEGLQVGRSGELYYLEASRDGGRELVRYRLDAHGTTSLVDGVEAFHVPSDARRLLYRKQGQWRILPLEGEAGESVARLLPLDAVSVRIEPRAEWRQIAREAWRIKRDYFYDPDMHGADWVAVWKRYAPLLEQAATRADVDRIMSWMSSELAVGHSYVFPGQPLEEPRHARVGLLGADYEVTDGRYRFSKIYRSHWMPDLAAPLERLDAPVVEGEYLLEVDGVDVDASASVYSYFQGTAGRKVALTVGRDPDGRRARTIEVVPVESDLELRRVDWIERNIRAVDAASGGRVAYVYLHDTARRGHDLFRRYFFPQSHKQAIIVDARFNRGGSFADYYGDLLRRVPVGRFSTRYGEDLRVPRGAISGPKILLTNKMTRSGGDLFAYMFRALGIGPIVGETTTGALVGNLGVPELMDGGLVTAPNFGFWAGDDGWAVENEGVPPDIAIEQTPAAVNAGRDPQLEKAVEIALGLLEDEKSPPRLRRPAYPRPADR